MNSPFTLVRSLLVVVAASLVATGCARRMTVATATTIGLHATPGDGQSQTPQVTLAYKRAELAMVPTGAQAAKKDASNGDTDAFSALAIIDFRTKWFGETSIDQFIATGHAARDIQDGPEFTGALLGVYAEPPPDIVERRNALARMIGAKLASKTAAEQNEIAAELLQLTGRGDVRQPATNVLHRALEDVQTDAAMTQLESAFVRIP